MKFFLPDAQDLVDPSFDFKRETRSPDRIRQRDDRYAHEVFKTPPYNGILVSKGIVEGTGGGSGRYPQSQRLRLLREGVQKFFRVHDIPRWQLEFMGDCGAFSYVKETNPPYTVDEVIEFYEGCRFDYGISVDHVILDYKPDWDVKMFGKDAVPTPIRQRQELTLKLARDFYARNRSSKLSFTPVGVAQGWSPKSYAYAVRQLQRIGYEYIALGGVVPLKTDDVLRVMQEVSAVRLDKTKLHMLGVTRIAEVRQFSRFGVASFDSTSPLRQAFKDDKDNYYTSDGTYTAIRIPQVQGNAKFQKRIRSGEVDQHVARAAEQRCLRYMEEFDRGKRKTKSVLKALSEYGKLYDPNKDRTEAYRRTLEAAPWKYCPCEVCSALGHHVILFRGAERNRRRGFHNIWVFYRRLQRGIGRRRPKLVLVPEPRATAQQQAFL